MLITVRHQMAPHTILTVGALDGVIGRIISLEWPGGPSKAKIADAAVIEEGRACSLTLDVPQEVAAFLEEVLDDGLQGYSIEGFPS